MKNDTRKYLTIVAVVVLGLSLYFSSNKETSKAESNNTTGKTFKQYSLTDNATGSRLILSTETCSIAIVLHGVAVEYRDQGSKAYKFYDNVHNGKVKTGCWWVQRNDFMLQYSTGDLAPYPSQWFIPEYK